MRWPCAVCHLSSKDSGCCGSGVSREATDPAACRCPVRRLANARYQSGEMKVLDFVAASFAAYAAPTEQPGVPKNFTMIQSSQQIQGKIRHGFHLKQKKPLKSLIYEHHRRSFSGENFLHCALTSLSRSTDTPHAATPTGVAPTSRGRAWLPAGIQQPS